MKRPSTTTPGTVSIPRALSKLGVCSRTQGAEMVAAGRVKINGAVVRNIGTRIRPEDDLIEVDGAPVTKTAPIYIALNKPRGLVTTRNDPQGRATIYDCLKGAGLPFVGPVGRLDKASEGLLLLTNDTRWSASVLDPSAHVDKTYHVQVRGAGLETVVGRASGGIIERSTNERLSVKRISLLRTGSRTSAWFEIVLDEGKNRQLRRIFAELDLEVTRLVRVAIGTIPLGKLAKGDWRFLSEAEVRLLARRDP
jgi:23S rRNA pseudouridine2605 synthase